MAKLRDQIYVVRDSDGEIRAIFKAEFKLNFPHIVGKMTTIMGPEDDVWIEEMVIEEGDES